MTMPPDEPLQGNKPSGRPGPSDIRRLARWIMVSFILTFLTTRCIVFLIMDRRIPDLYLYVGQTHVHHLNYGIFLLSAVGAYLLLGHPEGRRQTATAVLYGIGLALTFDEFGMWLHLGGGYWQRASFDAITVIAAMLALLAVAPPFRRLRAVHWTTAALLVAGCALFMFLMVKSLGYVGHSLTPRLQQLEQKAPQ
jgi:hypothetical protein